MMATYDEYKDSFSRLTDYRDEQLHHRFRVIMSAIPNGATVLDVACGSGTLMAALRDQKGCRCKGIDVAPGAVAVAQAKGLDVLRGDIDSFEINSAVRDLLLAPYDVVVFSKCLVYLKNKSQLFRSLRARSVIINEGNPIYWKRLVGISSPMNPTLPYVTADGEAIAMPWSGALKRWARSYGYRARGLHGGGILRRDFVLHFYRAEAADRSS